jgi:DNA-binding ferritin-like protein (Dps family)
MDKKKLTLDDIFNDDELGILDTKAKVSNIKSENDRLIESFLEVNAFFEKNNREPKADVFIVNERSLGVRLKGFRNCSLTTEILKPYDTHDLLGEISVEITSVDDILNDDELGILDTDDASEIFNIKNVPTSAERAETDFTARRKAMKDKDFAPYEANFKAVNKDLREGKRKLSEFKDVEQNLEKGKYYILDGILLFLEEDGIEGRKLGDVVRKDGRTKIIFENGTVSNMYYRSLSKGLYNNGRIVSNTDSEAENELFKNANILNEEDIETGWIYVLKSKSTNQSISEIKDLHKIGFSKLDVKARIKNAAKEPTYLLAEVEIVSTYKCYSVNPHKFEQLLHRFFAEVCLNVDIHDNQGRRITPREWFVVPFAIIDKVIDLILDETIVKYRYDHENKAILEIP